MALSVMVAVVILLLTAAVKGDDGGQEGETHEEVKNIEAMSSCTQNANMLTGAAEKPEPDEEFEEWVKPHIEGMVPVYGRAGIDYISLDDFELMGKTVFAEAKTEEFEGQVAVAEVILNRVESENFPDTVEEVIKQDGAFSSWGNGSVEAAPLDDECLEAVQDAVNERFFRIRWFISVRGISIRLERRTRSSDIIISAARRERTGEDGRAAFPEVFVDVQGQGLPSCLPVLRTLSYLHHRRGNGKERKRNEYEIRNEERGHGADCSRPVGAVQREPLSGIEVAAPLPERGQQEST